MRNRMEIGAAVAGFAAILLLTSLVVYKSYGADSAERQAAETLLNGFVDEALIERRLTLKNYENLLKGLSIMSGVYKPEISIGRSLWCVGENEGETVKSAGKTTEILYTNEIAERLIENESITLEEGDILSVRLKVIKSSTAFAGDFIYGLNSEKGELTAGCVIGR